MMENYLRKISLFNNEKENKIYHFLSYFILVLLILKSSIADEIIVKNEDEFQTALLGLKGERTIIINGKLFFDMKNDFKVMPPTNYGSIILKGINKEESIIDFKYRKYGIIFENITSVEICDLTFYGHIQLMRIEESGYIHDIDHMGLTDTRGAEKGGQYKFKNYNFIANDQDARAKSVQLTGGNTYIEDSRFVGSIGCTESVVRYNGKTFEEREFHVKNCFFNGNHYCNGMIVQEGNFSLYNSNFINGYNRKQG